MELKLPREGSAFWFVTLPTLPVIFAFRNPLVFCCRDGQCFRTGVFNL